MYRASLLISLALFGCAEPTPIGEEFSGNWRQPSSQVMGALAKARISGCGEFYQKPSTVDQNSYVVACTRDRKKWVGYMVWPNIDSVLGPDTTLVYQVGGPPFAEKLDGTLVVFSKVEP